MEEMPLHSLRILSAMLACMILLTQSFVVAHGAEDSRSINIEVSNESVQNMITIGVDDLGVQLDDLYREIGNQLDIDYIYIKLIHLIAGGKAVYADKRPNIYTDLTVDSLSGSFDIGGITPKELRLATWAKCPDTSIQRPNKNYLPDVAYSVSYEIHSIMEKRQYYNREGYQVYFDSLKPDVKTNILFCEAILSYLGATQEQVDSFYGCYEKIIYDKYPNENVVEYLGEGKFKLKDRFKEIFIDNGIASDEYLDILAVVLSFDKGLAESNNIDNMSDYFDIPYKVDYTSRENMMAAAMSIVGKVRYVWGGGHLGSGEIKGINPVWKLFNNCYGTSEEMEGYNQCVRPNTSWCPLHGEVHDINGCMASSPAVYSAEEYIATLDGVISDDVDIEKYMELLDNIDQLKHGMSAHRFDGLDCSGYTTWLYNQIDPINVYGGGASTFVTHNIIDEIPLGSELLPGDVFAWSSHIIVIVGKVQEESDSYIILEASPNTIKFGVAYYGEGFISEPDYTDGRPRSTVIVPSGGVTPEDLELGKQIATEANTLLGGIDKNEKVNCYNLNQVGFYNDEVVTLDDGTQYLDRIKHDENSAKIGRLSRDFIDEDLVLQDYEKRITDMTAQEIIQHTINNYELQYLTGRGIYQGELFQVEGIEAIKKKEEEERNKFEAGRPTTNQIEVEHDRMSLIEE